MNRPFISLFPDRECKIPRFGRGAVARRLARGFATRFRGFAAQFALIFSSDEKEETARSLFLNRLLLRRRHLLVFALPFFFSFSFV